MSNLQQLVVGTLTHLFQLVCRIYVDQVVIMKAIIICEGHNEELVYLVHVITILENSVCEHSPFVCSRLSRLIVVC